MAADVVYTDGAMGDPVYVLGVNAYDHDVSACLLKDGVAVVAINKERLTRDKHDAGFYGDPVSYCLFVAGITLDDVALVVRCSYLQQVQSLETALLSRVYEGVFPPDEREAALRSPLYLGRGHRRVVDVSHHLAHAYSAFACSPFEQGAVMVVDGVGSYRRDVMESVPEDSDGPDLAREAESYYTFDGSKLQTVRKVWLGPAPGLVNEDFHCMRGIGGLYSRVSTYIFGHWNRCGEVMGLAPYGSTEAPTMLSLPDDDGARDLEFPAWPSTHRHPYAGRSDHDWTTSPHQQHWQDLAWRVQADTEAVLLARARWLHEKTRAKNLVLAGGVALNCVANGRIQSESPFERVFIQPAAGDDGTAIGAALYGHVEVLGNERAWVMTHPYLGLTYPDQSVTKALQRPAIRACASAKESEDVVGETADLLAAGNVVGWVQGGAEFGPRALGNRSILADPRDPGMKDRVNARVKFRQGFRPFAPAVLAEHAGDWFEESVDSPFMLLTRVVRPERRAHVPSIVHVDGTARVQTVHAETNPRFHALITAFFERTGCPIVLNTSFNLRGEPIVESPAEAAADFLACDLDVLVLHDWIVKKRRSYRSLRPFVRRWERVRRGLSRESWMRRAARGAGLETGA